MEHPPQRRPNAQIHAEACGWFIECRAGDLDASGRRRFDDWLRQSPEHLGAYLAVAAVWNEAGLLDATGKYDQETLLADAALDRGEVVALAAGARAGRELGIERGVPSDPAGRPSDPGGRSSESDVCPRGRVTRKRLALPLATVLLALLAVGGLIGFQAARRPTYATVVGEQRSLTLEDGSAVTLNARSTIRVRYSKGERGVELVEGQALFHVRKDAARPFVVSSGTTQVRAVGTEFDVHRIPDAVVVTVVEGQVAVASSVPTQASAPAPAALPAGRTGALLVSAGEQLVAGPAAVTLADHPNVAGALAWTQHQLVFESASLAEVAEEFNRYNERRLVILDPKLDTFHISGVFSSTDPASLIRFLRTRPGFHVVETASEIHIEK